ncbi:MAG: pantetheine-phosphate adenylyltransferase [Bacteriovoracaceae bacterium]|jgi:pantetheine-phosphate adenylyltransferase|nr:pantetheine-phosphate adenylyltransferase [Bacteriovoracaceae bacterium]
MSGKTALYAGTFDPFTNGHYDIIKRGLPLFDELTILLAVSPTKKPLFPVEERKKMIEELFENNSKIKVAHWDGLVVDFVKRNKIDVIIRGLRPTGDFEFEFQMASMNRHLEPEVETVFFMTGEKYYFVSSTLVKEVYEHGGKISELVPPSIHKKLMGLKQGR